jgi:hypothetical protein
MYLLDPLSLGETSPAISKRVNILWAVLTEIFNLPAIWVKVSSCTGLCHTTLPGSADLGLVDILNI